MDKQKAHNVQLVWDGKKKNIDCAVNKIFRQYEVVYPHPIYSADEMWFENHLSGLDFNDKVSNCLYCGDNLYLLQMINERPIPSLDLIYIDPPYLSDSVYLSRIQPSSVPYNSPINRVAFADRWGNGVVSYLEMLYPRLQLMHKILSEQGSLLVHLDWHVSHYVRLLLDEIFGPDNIVNEIIWCYGGGSWPKKHFQRKHDVIFWYAKGKDYIFNPQYRPYTQGTLQRGLTKVKGERYRLREQGALMQDWWTDINKILSPTASENLKYPTQKPRELLKRLILSASNPGSTVADFFAGSGTTAQVCNELGRNWILCDDSPLALQTCHYRLSQNGDAPFLLASTETDKGEMITLTAHPVHEYDHNHVILKINLVKDIGCSDPSGIEFWEIDLDYRDMFRSCFQMRRNNRFKGELPQELVAIVPKKDVYRIGIRLYDMYARQTLKIIELHPRV